ncbi:MAG: hypothetical protein AAGU27_00955 [Dehalobacterium sp.]
MADDKVMRKNGQLPTPDPCNCYQNDHVDLVVEGAGIRLSRLSTLSIPGELSAYIPRVEIRQRHYENGQLVREDERIYNSITVVHAPRHPLENPPDIPTIESGPILIESTNNNTFPRPTLSNPPVPAPPEPGEQPPPPEVPTAPGPDQPGAVEPPVIPSQPEPHLPPVSPHESNLNFPARAVRKTDFKTLPVITINKRRV